MELKKICPNLSDFEIVDVKKLAESFPQTSEETILKCFDSWKNAGMDISSLIELFYLSLSTDQTIDETPVGNFQTALEF